MKTFLKYITLVLSPILFFNSCAEADDYLDTEKPEILLATPSEHQEFEFGDTINVQALFKDNIELGSYKIEIHAETDGHEHKNLISSRTVKANDDSNPWSYNHIADISGNKEYLLNHSIQIPEGDFTEGHYHFGIILTDKAGNEKQSFIEIVIGDDHHH
jgi:hypothetical protein